MAKLTDGTKTVEIIMRAWNTARDDFDNPEDMTDEIFSLGDCDRDSSGAYIVDDIDYIVSQAEDWENKSGDFSSDVWPDYLEPWLMID